MMFSRNRDRRITMGLTAGLLLTGLAMAGCSNNTEEATASPSPGAMNNNTAGGTTGGAMGGTTSGTTGGAMRGTTGGGTTGAAAPPGPGTRP